MPIDDYVKTQALMKKLEANLPITARPGKPFLKMMQDRGKVISADHTLSIDSVIYAGDEGGILCAIAPEEQDQEAYAVSITFLRIDPKHPLAEEVQAYQKQRTQKLRLQKQRGFLAFQAEAPPRGAGKTRKRHRGFGQ